MAEDTSDVPAEIIKQESLYRWNGLKFMIHIQGILCRIKEEEVWWCSLGENIGTEINGKGELFSRPVLIYRKLGSLQFLGIPLSSKEHNGTWYVNFRFKGREQYACLNQIRVINVSRLQERMGTVDKADMKKVINGFRALYY